MKTDETCCASLCFTFLLLGAAIFLIHGLVSKHSADQARLKLLSPKGKWKIL